MLDPKIHELITDLEKLFPQGGAEIRTYFAAHPISPISPAKINALQSYLLQHRQKYTNQQRYIDKLWELSNYISSQQVNIKTETFFSAITHGDLPKVRQLLQQGVNLAWTDRDGQTVLHIACANAENKEALTIIHELLAWGAEWTEAKDNSGRTPEQVLSTNGVDNPEVRHQLYLIRIELNKKRSHRQFRDNLNFFNQNISVTAKKHLKSGYCFGATMLWIEKCLRSQQAGKQHSLLNFYHTTRILFETPAQELQHSSHLSKSRKSLEKIRVYQLANSTNPVVRLVEISEEKKRIRDLNRKTVSTPLYLLKARTFLMYETELHDYLLEQFNYLGDSGYDVCINLNVMGGKHAIGLRKVFSGYELYDINLSYYRLTRGFHTFRSSLHGAIKFIFEKYGGDSFSAAIGLNFFSWRHSINLLAESVEFNNEQTSSVSFNADNLDLLDDFLMISAKAGIISSSVEKALADQRTAGFFGGRTYHYYIFTTGMLYMAAHAGQQAVVEYLLNLGDVDINGTLKKAFGNSSHSEGSTALHAAAENGHIEIVKFLLEKNAKRHLRNKDRYTPYDLAHQNQYFDICNLLT